MWSPWKKSQWAVLAALALLAGGRAIAQGEAEIEYLDGLDSAQEGDVVGFITNRIAVYGVPASTVAVAPERFHGKVLSVPGQVGHLLSSHVFTLHEPGEGPRPGVIVIARLSAQAVQPGQAVRVLGQLRPLVFEELESDFDWFDRSWFGSAGPDFQHRPTLVAASVVLLEDEQELLQGLETAPPPPENPEPPRAKPDLRSRAEIQKTSR
jgi:hypothetical protein